MHAGGRQGTGASSNYSFVHVLGTEGPSLRNVQLLIIPLQDHPPSNEPSKAFKKI